jgi:hypothetical protein
VRGRVVGGSPQIAPARDDRAVAHDHRPEGKIALAGLVERHAHESHVLAGGRTAGLRMRDRGRDRAGREPGEKDTSAWSNDRVPACAVFVAIHVNPSANVRC